MHSLNSLGSSNSAWAAVSNQRSSRPPGGNDSASFQDKLFSKLDADGSGGVGSGELQGLLDTLSSKLGTAVGGSDAEAAFSTMDQNADGSLDKAELSSGLKAAFAALPDTVSFARSRGADSAGGQGGPGGPGGPGGDEAAHFTRADADGSGGISADELKADMEASPRAGGQTVAQDKVDALMSKLDTDGSGDISSSEMAAGRPAGGHGDGVRGDNAARSDATGHTQGPPPGGPPPSGGAHGAKGAGGGGNDGDSDDSSSATDPLDTNSDGTVSTSERMAGALKEMTQSLIKAVDSNGDGKVNNREAKRFGELLHKMSGSAGASSGGAEYSASQGGRSGSAQAMADQVTRHYAQAALASASAGSRFSMEA